MDLRMYARARQGGPEITVTRLLPLASAMNLTAPTMEAIRVWTTVVAPAAHLFAAIMLQNQLLMLSVVVLQLRPNTYLTNAAIETSVFRI